MNRWLLILMVLLCIVILPAWPYSIGWGYYPSAGVGVIFIILFLLALSGRI